MNFSEDTEESEFLVPEINSALRKPFPKKTDDSLQFTEDICQKRHSSSHRKHKNLLDFTEESYAYSAQDNFAEDSSYSQEDVFKEESLTLRNTFPSNKPEDSLKFTEEYDNPSYSKEFKKRKTVNQHGMDILNFTESNTQDSAFFVKGDNSTFKKTLPKKPDDSLKFTEDDLRI